MHEAARRRWERAAEHKSLADEHKAPIGQANKGRKDAKATRAKVRAPTHHGGQGSSGRGHTGMPTVRVAEHAAVAAHKAALAAEQAAVAAQAASQAFEHGHASDTRVATIGLIGALIGGVVTGGTQLLGDGLKRRQDRKEKVKQAQGVGRALRFYLDQWATMIKNRTRDGSPWWTVGQEPSQHWDADDVQLIAGSLDHDQWEDVRAAMTAARNLSANRLDGIEKNMTVEAFFAIPEVHLQREIRYLDEGCDTLAKVFK